MASPSGDEFLESRTSPKEMNAGNAPSTRRGSDRGRVSGEWRQVKAPESGDPRHSGRQVRKPTPSLSSVRLPMNNAAPNPMTMA